MISHPKPVKCFETPEGDSWYDYRFVGAHRNCWIWHIITDRQRFGRSDIRYITQCPDGWILYSQTLTEAKMKAGRWDNGQNMMELVE